MWFMRSSKDLLPPSLASKSAVDVATAAKLSDQAQSLLEPQMTAGDYLGVLMQQKRGVDAVPFLANLMPPEKGVQWAVESCEMAAPGGPACSESAQAIAAAKAWVANPGPQTQEAAATAAAAAPKNDPAAWAAQAAAWGGEGGAEAMMAQTNEAAAAAGLETAAILDAMAESIPANLSAQAVSGAVMLAAAQASPKGTVPDLPQGPGALQTPGAAPPSAQVPEKVTQAVADVVMPTAPELGAGVALPEFPQSPAGPQMPPPASPTVVAIKAVDFPASPSPPEVLAMDKKQIAKAHAQLKPFIEKGIEVANEQPVVDAPS